MSFKDHFSQQSASYSRYRPHYPEGLFSYLASQVERHERAWDCGTGSGQAALELARFFAEVIATDASEQQIANALYHERVRYRVAPAEASGLDADSVDLITVAQALHWFDQERFYTEVRRVLRPGGVLAVWCYRLARVSPAVDAVLDRFYTEIVGPFWPPERELIDQGYRTVPFPFAELESPHFEMEAEWTLPHLLGYLGTWSAVQRYREQKGQDPLEVIQSELIQAWGRPETMASIRWPVYLRLGRHRPVSSSRP